MNEVDYVLIYSRSGEVDIEGVPFSEDDAAIYDKQDEHGRYLIRPLRRTGGEDRREDRPTMFYSLTAPDGSQVLPYGPTGYESRWICGPDRFQQLNDSGLIEWRKAEDGRWQVYQRFYAEGRSKQPSNLWAGLEGNKKATRDLRSMFGDEKVFDHPKPVGLVSHMIRIASADPSALVLDFFAGAGVTGEAVLRVNQEDGGRRRYILVQLPEPTGKSDFDTIAEITKERLRRAAAEIREESPMVTGDLGFRVFKLDSSNIQEWDPQPEDLEATLDAAVENLKADRSEQDILYELLLKRGIELTVPIETREVTGKPVHSIGAGTLFACLDERVERADAEPLALGIVAWRDELDPAADVRVVFRDSAFVDDVAKTNLAEILKQHGLADVKSI